MSPVMFVSWKCLFFCEVWTGNILIGTSHPTYLSSILEPFSILSAYHLPNRPQPQPDYALCRTPPYYPFAYRFCHPFTTIPYCHTVTICLSFQWSLCRNRFSITECACSQVCCNRVARFCSRSSQFCSSLTSVCSADQSLHCFSSWSTALCRPLLISSSAPSRYKSHFSMPSCSSTSHGSSSKAAQDSARQHPQPLLSPLAG